MQSASKASDWAPGRGLATLGLFVLILGGDAMLSAQASTAAAAPPTVHADAELRALNHRFVDSLGASQYRFAAGANLRGAVSYRDVEVRLFGDVALIHGIVELSGGDGAAARSRYTDVYQWTGASWMRVGSQSTPIQSTAKLAIQRGTAPRSAQWSGHDPTGDELSILRALNEAYVNAFREADVAWYEAHLAPDYLVINPDGSLSDRAAALQDFAQPVFATKMISFPVDKVSIRLLGDIALIHAENHYELKDGRRGVSHYTDIWHRSDGRWRCVAAHITPQVWPR